MNHRKFLILTFTAEVHLKIWLVLRNFYTYLAINIITFHPCFFRLQIEINPYQFF